MRDEETPLPAGLGYVLGALSALLPSVWAIHSRLCHFPGGGASTEYEPVTGEIDRPKILLGDSATGSDVFWTRPARHKTMVAFR